MTPPPKGQRQALALIRLVERRRGASLIVASNLFIAAFVLRVITDRAEEPVGLLFTIPIALVALALGATGGFVAALGSLALLGIWDATSDESIGLVGYLLRGVAFSVLGLLVGSSSSVLREVEHRLDRLGLDIRGDWDELPAATSAGEQSAASDRAARAAPDEAATQ